MPECMICHHEIGWNGDWSMHMFPPLTIEDIQKQLVTKSFIKIQFEPPPEDKLTRGRKRGMQARDGGPCSGTLF